MNAARHFGVSSPDLLVDVRYNNVKMTEGCTDCRTVEGYWTRKNISRDVMSCVIQPYDPARISPIDSQRVVEYIAGVSEHERALLILSITRLTHAN